MKIQNRLIISAVLLTMACDPAPPARRTTPSRTLGRRAPPRPDEPSRPARPLEPPASWKAYFTVMRGEKPVGQAYLGFEKNDEGARYEVRQSVETTWGRVTQHVTFQVNEQRAPKWLKAVEMEQVANTTLRIYTQLDVKPVVAGVEITTTRFGHRWSQVVAPAGALPIARYPLLAAYYLARRYGRQSLPSFQGTALEPYKGTVGEVRFEGKATTDRGTFKVDFGKLGTLTLDYDVPWAKLHGVTGTGTLFGYRAGGKPPVVVPPPADFAKARAATPFHWPAALKAEPLEVKVGGGLSVKGVLTLPARRRPPLVVLVPGADVTDLDGSRGQRKLNAELAALLTGAGYATYRFAPRGVGRTGGDRAQVTLAGRLADLRVIVARLKKDRRLNRKRVLLLGHAEGGVVALRYAATRGGDLHGLVLLSTPGVEYSAYLLDQWRRRWETAGMPLKIVNQRMAWFKGELDKVAKGARHDFLGRPGGLVADLLKIDPLKDYKKVRLRALVLAGQADVTVQTDDVNALRAGMPGNKRLTVVQPGGVGHLLQHSPRFLELSEMWKIPAPIDEAAKRPLLDWLAAQTK